MTLGENSETDQQPRVQTGSRRKTVKSPFVLDRVN